MAAVFKLPKRLERLLADPTPALRAIGSFMARESRQAFQQQRYGGITWPPQYPGQSDPFIHIAGALTDLANVSDVKARRYRRNKALFDRGRAGLFGSIGFRVAGKQTVEVGVTGSVIDYARKHALPGGVSRIRITRTMRQNLSALMKRLRGTGRKKKKGGGKIRIPRSKVLPKVDPLAGIKRIFSKIKRKPPKARAAARKPSISHQQKLKALQKLGFIFQTNIFEQNIAWRPFVGITSRTEEAVPKIVKAVFEGRSVSGVL